MLHEDRGKLPEEASGWVVKSNAMVTADIIPASTARDFVQRTPAANQNIGAITGGDLIRICGGDAYTSVDVSSLRACACVRVYTNMCMFHYDASSAQLSLFKAIVLFCEFWKILDVFG